MDRQTHGTSPAGRLVQVGSGEAAYRAFAPHPLPPRLDLDLRLWQILSEADRAVGRLDGMCRELPQPHLLIRPLMRQEAVLSSRIEGTESDLADLLAFEAGQPALFSDRPEEEDVREVHNYVVALEYALERRKSLPLSLRLVREIHERLMQGVRGRNMTPGEFRRTQNWIGPPGCTLNQADFVSPPPEELMPALGAWEEYLHAEGDYPPLVRLAFIHYQFEALHPFLDGNGRIGRLLLALLLVHWELVSEPLLYLSEYFERHRDQYYDLLAAVSERGAWAEWVEFFVSGVASQAAETIARTQALLELRDRWRRRLREVGRSANLLRLADALIGMPFFTIPDVQRLLGVRYPTAANLVRKLEEAGVVRAVLRQRPKRFFAPEVLEVLSNT